MLHIFTGIILFSIFLVIYRVVKGPGFFNRALATNVIGTKTIILIALVGSFPGHSYFIDIALTYAIINFIGTLAILKYIKRGGLE